MRPQYLELTAVGPYPGTVSIDFDELAPYGLFHIHGPTGAGKSTLLDAMCFALYGELPYPRLTDNLRSHHAGAVTESVVTFDFTAQDKDWRIVRKPFQMRAKKVGSGQTVQRESVTLLERHGNAFTPVASAAKEVKDIVAGLIGLDATQFMQVVVLPQGGFQRALRATDSERAKLLSTLFDTERFGRYSEHLKSRSDKLKREVEKRSSKPLSMFVQAASRSAALGLELEWPAEMELSTQLGDQISEAAELALSVRDQAAENLSVTAAERTAADQLRQALAVDADKFLRRASAERQLAELRSTEVTVTDLRSRLRDADNAAPIAALAHQVEPVRKRVDSLSQRQAEHRAELLVLAKQLPDDATSLGQAVSSLEATDAEARQITEAQTAASAFISELDVAMVHLETAERFRGAAKQSALASETAARELGILENKQEVIRVELEGLKVSGNTLTALAAQTSDLELDVERLLTQGRASKALAAHNAALTEKRTELISLESKANEAVRSHLELWQKRLDGMAGELAQTLNDGEACQVCGSQVHPHVAQPSADAIHADDVAKAANQAESARHRALECSASISSMESEAQALASQAGPFAADIEAARNAFAEAKNALDAAIQAAADADRVSHQINTLETELVRVTQGAELARAQLVEHETAAKHDQAEADRCSALVNDRFDNPLQINVLKLLVTKVVTLVGGLEQLLLAHKEALAQLAIEQAALDTSVAESQFASQDEAIACALSEANRQQIRDQLEAHNSAIAAATAVLSELEPAVAFSEDALADAEKRCTVASEIHDHASSELGRVSAEVQQLERLASNYKSEYEAIAPTVKEYQRVRHLFEICSGANHKRMDLQRYVLAAYLEEVAIAAGERLRVMTSGRYSLRHSDARARRNAASGLTLLVADAFTGQEREVSTLSGGETFLASLALALGLADVVQAHAGGVRIEALFIDEGFGSLDADTLDIAIAELDRLREGGRLVGVISHVPTLRERVPAGVEVVAGTQGSTVRIVKDVEALVS